ncbi:hybrid sensor histidine kinase/response regulator [Minwuia thermotolerans]|uniref:histidine kinase n=1 Tax=Minwuia thermotolerans TaxID=2056226 RepID=A0A2M9FX17_9PROT|nr:hybrid sensor histidine kinase/response regulator [Minwuia thermotolerans]PJK27979.1 hybrid sensor histidine kinase/response regulator [Minwuia thermotolerans]
MRFGAAGGTALRVAAVYAAAGFLYILGSDWLVEHGFSSDWRPGIQSVKGMGFVLITALGLGLICRFFIRRGMAQIISVNAALEKSRERFELIADNVGEVLWIGDPRDRGIHYVSPAYETIWGRSSDAMFSDPGSWMETVHPDDRAYTRRKIRERQRQSNVAEYRIVRPDGAIRWIEDRGFPVRNESGEVYRVVGVARDITEHRQAKAHIEELRSRFEKVIAAAPVGILVHRDFTPILANEALARTLGYSSADEILGLPDCLALFAEEERDRIVQFNRQRMRGGDPPKAYDLKGKTRDGSIIELENRVTVLDWGGSPAVCTILADVSEQRETERQLRKAQKFEAIGQLTGGVAHDFNNLLTVVIGNAGLLEQRLDGRDEDSRSLVDTILKAANLGAELTHNLLAYSRRQVLAPAATDVAALIEGMRLLLQRTLGEHIEIAISHERSIDDAYVDASQLQNSILNLCLNARDAMPEGGLLRIEMTNTRLDADADADAAQRQADVTPGPYVSIAVSDTGTGMPEEVVRHAFEPFFTTKESDRGSGLGLSMVFGFIKQTGGHLDVDSEVGRGTTIRLYLPRAETPTRPREEPPAAPAMEGRGELVLLAEDDAMVRDFVVLQLSLLGYRVMEAANGQEALALLEQNEDIDLLFTDIVMSGGMSGRQLADAAQRIRPRLPVLFTSGYTEASMLNEGWVEPGMRLLQKPFQREDLARMVRSTLDRDA